jgi:hypothetical protein
MSISERMEAIKKAEKEFLDILDEKSKTEYEQMKTEIKDQTEHLWRDFYPPTQKYLNYLEESDRIIRGFQKSTEIMAMLTKIVAKSSESAMVRCLANVIVYLTSVETDGNMSANTTLLLLAADGRYVHLQPDKRHWYVRHATRLKDFEASTLSIGTKIDFLASEGCRFFKEWINTDLRNRIAHSDFFIDDNGDFFIVKEKNGTPTRTLFNLTQEILRFRMYNYAFNVIFMEQMTRITH